MNVTNQVSGHSADPTYKVRAIFDNIAARNFYDVLIIPEFGEGPERIPEHLDFSVTFSVLLGSKIPREGHESDQPFLRRIGCRCSMKCGHICARVLAKEDVGVALEG
jgi:hypothetical protein